MNDSEIIVVRACGELDRTATHQLVDDVHARVTEKTEVIVLSLAQTTTVRWNALCLLSKAARRWRDAAYAVVVKEARPSVRALLELTFYPDLIRP